MAVIYYKKKCDINEKYINYKNEYALYSYTIFRGLHDYYIKIH